MENQKQNSELQALDRNIATIHRMRKSSDESRRVDQKFVDAVSSFAGSTDSLYLHILVYGGWLFVNYMNPFGLKVLLGLSPEKLSLVASLEAIFLAVFVLINQRRMDAVERRNSDLHLQMSLLTEHEITRLARVTDLMAKKLGVIGLLNAELEDVKKDILPDEILSRLSEHEKKIPTDSAPIADPKK